MKQSSDEVAEKELLRGLNRLLDTDLASIEEAAQYLDAHPELRERLEPSKDWVDPVTGLNGWDT